MIREWTDPRDRVTWRVRAFRVDADAAPVPQGWVPPYGDFVPPSMPRISFEGGEGDAEHWVTEHPSGRSVDQLSDAELQALLDQARAASGRAD